MQYTNQLEISELVTYARIICEKTFGQRWLNVGQAHRDYCINEVNHLVLTSTIETAKILDKLERTK